MCVPEFNHPVRLAERAAVMDILSGGRLDFGTGRSATWTELGGFRASPDTTKATWDELVSAIPKMWTGAPRHGRARADLRRARGAGEEDEDLPSDHP